MLVGPFPPLYGTLLTQVTVRVHCITSFLLIALFFSPVFRIKVVEVDPESESVFPGITEMTNELKVRET